MTTPGMLNSTTQAPWPAVLPGLAVLPVVLAFDLAGDGLRDALDPRGNRR
ncbi:hypothetical protein [Roseicella aerolata]